MMPGATILDGTGDSGKNENTEEKKDTTDTTDTTDVKDTTDPTEDDQKNIFDNPLDFTTADKTGKLLRTISQKKSRLQGLLRIIVVREFCISIDLPWYVQFQVTSGENYEFKNEDNATIFQSYEFKLWDLKE